MMVRKLSDFYNQDITIKSTKSTEKKAQKNILIKHRMFAIGDYPEDKENLVITISG